MSSPEPLRILVTNDDGVDSPGLWHLAAALRGPGREVVVAAPSRDSSGFAAAVGDIAAGAIVEAHPTAWPEPWSGSAASHDPAWVVDGPPGRCVLAGILGIFGPRPQLVVSGINAGANTGRFLQLHSGTLGAALTAGNSGLCAMAVSLDTSPRLVPTEGEVRHWTTAAEIAAALVDQLVAQPRSTVWNVNVPNVERSAITGIAEARLGRSRSRIVAMAVGDGRHELRMERTAPRVDEGDGLTDRALLDAGSVSVTSVAGPSLSAVGPITLGAAVGTT